MSAEIERIIGRENLVKGVAILPFDEGRKYDKSDRSDDLGEIFPMGKNSKISYFYGAKNNLPDVLAMNATKRVIEMCRLLTENDILLTLISGGGSALLTQPIDLIAGRESGQENLHLKLATIKNLVKSGADINELNTVNYSIFFLIVK